MHPPGVFVVFVSFQSLNELGTQWLSFASEEDCMGIYILIKLVVK